MSRSIFYFAMSILLILSIAGIPSCVNPPPCPGTYTGSLDTISKEQAQFLQDNFHEWANTCSFRSGKEPGQPDTTNHVWFDIDKINDLVMFAHNYSCQNPNAPKISGIRIYFGRYGDNPPVNSAGNANFSNIPEPNRLTVIMSPTIEDASGKNINNPDLGFGVVNYGHAGEPPKKKYPQ